MPDYRAAARRHFDDAKHLQQETRLANADHLYGFAAECALKSVMLGLGMAMAGDKPARPHNVHVDVLWSLFDTFVNGNNGAKYAGFDPNTNPFSGWSVNDRYESGAHLTPVLVGRHATGADQTMKCLAQAELDGLV